MALYITKFNWQGELHTFFTNSNNIESAFKNSVIRLAKKVGYSYTKICNYFISEAKDNYSIHLIKRRDSHVQS